MVNHMRAVTKKITDFQIGSVSRTLVEAPAIEIEEAYHRMFLGLREAIPVATFLSFGFDKLAASKAVGYVTISTPTPRTALQLIVTGTVFFTTDGRSYRSTADVIWDVGSTLIQVPVIAALDGLAGNVGAGVINSSPSFPSPYVVSNPSIQSGRDAETDAQREARFADFVKSLSRGTVDAIRYAAKQAMVKDTSGLITEYVTRIGLIENPGYVRVFIYSSLGLPSVALLANGQKIMDGWRDSTTGISTPGYRSGGVRVDVLGMGQRVVDCSIQIAYLDGYSGTPAMIQSLNDVFTSKVQATATGETLYIQTIVEALLAVVGVKTIIAQTTSNYVCGQNEALIPGTLTIAGLTS